MTPKSSIGRWEMDKKELGDELFGFGRWEMKKLNWEMGDG